MPARLEELTNERRRVEAGLAEARSRAEASGLGSAGGCGRASRRRAHRRAGARPQPRPPAAEERAGRALEARQALVEAATLAEAGRRPSGARVPHAPSSRPRRRGDRRPRRHRRCGPRSIPKRSSSTCWPASPRSGRRLLRRFGAAGAGRHLPRPRCRGPCAECSAPWVGMSETVQIIVLSDDTPSPPGPPSRAPSAAALVASLPPSPEPRPAAAPRAVHTPPPIHRTDRRQAAYHRRHPPDRGGAVRRDHRSRDQGAGRIPERGGPGRHLLPRCRRAPPDPAPGLPAAPRRSRPGGGIGPGGSRRRPAISIASRAYVEGDLDRSGVRGLAMFSCAPAGLWEVVAAARCRCPAASW